MSDWKRHGSCVKQTKWSSCKRWTLLMGQTWIQTLVKDIPSNDLLPNDLSAVSWSVSQSLTSIAGWKKQTANGGLEQRCEFYAPKKRERIKKPQIWSPMTVIGTESECGKRKRVKQQTAMVKRTKRKGKERDNANRWQRWRNKAKKKWKSEKSWRSELSNEGGVNKQRVVNERRWTKRNENRNELEKEADIVQKKHKKPQKENENKRDTLKK